MKKNILILGSEGQIGSHLVSFLKNKKNYNIIRYDITLKKTHDLRNFNNKKLSNVIKKSDFIFFLAFDVGGSKYLKKYENSFKFIENNIKIMQNVFSLIKSYKKKFIFASSQMSNMVVSNYGALKNIGEKYSLSLKVLSVKFWNVYGYENNKLKSHVITDFINMADDQREIKMITDGKEKRDFLYTKDCSRALFEMMENYDYFKKNHPIIDLATSRKISIFNIAKIIKNIFLKKFKIKISIKPSKKKDSVQKNIVNKPSKYFFKFWKPEYSIEKGIQELIVKKKNKEK